MRPPARLACSAQVTLLVEAMAGRGQSPRRTLRCALPAAARSLPPEHFHAAVDLAARLARRGIDPTAVLEHALPVVAGASRCAEDFAEGLGVLEEMVARLAAEADLCWAAVAHDLADLTRDALTCHGQEVPYLIRVTPEQVSRHLVPDWVRGYDAPVVVEVWTVDALQKVQLVPYPTGAARPSPVAVA
jgi:hypothetical protein